MKNYIPIFIPIVLLLISCNSKNHESKNTDLDIEKSLKEQDVKSVKEYLDSTLNIYSNFKYNVAYDGPDKWQFDKGIGKNTIYRTFERDSSITFSINVIETKKNTDKKKKRETIWSMYQKNKDQMDEPLIKLLEEQLNTKVQGFEAKKTYLKNNVALRRSLNYVIKNLDYEYNNTSIQYQVLIDNLTFTFTLNVPTMFYQKKPYYYEQLFNNVYFLKKEERLNQLIKNDRSES